MKHAVLGFVALAAMAMSPLPPGLPCPSGPAPAMAFPSTRGKPVVISLERTACFGRCPIYRVEIRGDGLVSYEGVRFVAVTGKRYRRISPAAVSRLVAQFRAADFYSLQDSYRANVTDLPSKIVTISIGGRTKRVLDYAGRNVGMPVAVNDIEEAIDRTAGTSAWVGAR